MTYKDINGKCAALSESAVSHSDLRAYVKAFGRKITPIMLTVISTILGLIPFLTDGPKEVFWFDFAIGTMGGMVFSVIAVLVVLPVFVIRRGKWTSRK